VTPSGGRMDEIIRAVRDCPSGALSFAIDKVEARAQVDWDGIRPRTIEVSKDGPYRITGSIPLSDEAGEPVKRAAGSSLEPLPPRPQTGRPGQASGRPLPRALRPLPLRPLAQQAVLQRHALVHRVPRPAVRSEPAAEPVRVGGRATGADTHDTALLRKAHPG